MSKSVDHERGKTAGKTPQRVNQGIRDVALQQGLRAAYRTVVEEPVPDRFLDLLQQLDGDGPTK